MSNNGSVSLTKAKMLLSLFGQEHGLLSQGQPTQEQSLRLNSIKMSMANLAAAIERVELNTNIESGWWDSWFEEKK